MANVVIFLVLTFAFLCMVRMSTPCSPGPDWQPLNVTELVKRAPIVVRGYLVKKIGSINIYKACLYISHIYKGRHMHNYICADNFGSSAACLSELRFGTEYLIFLDKKASGYRARYDDIHSAAKPFKDEVSIEIKKGKCCPRQFNRCESARLFCLIYRCGPNRCFCQYGQ